MFICLPCLVMRFVILGHGAPVKCGTNLEIGSIFSFQSHGWAFGEAKFKLLSSYWQIHLHV